MRLLLKIILGVVWGAILHRLSYDCISRRAEYADLYLCGIGIIGGLPIVGLFARGLRADLAALLAYGSVGGGGLLASLFED